MLRASWAASVAQWQDVVVYWRYLISYKIKWSNTLHGLYYMYLHILIDCMHKILSYSLMMMIYRALYDLVYTGPHFFMYCLIYSFTFDLILSLKTRFSALPWRRWSSFSANPWVNWRAIEGRREGGREGGREGREGGKGGGREGGRRGKKGRELVHVLYLYKQTCVYMYTHVHTMGRVG